MKKIIGLDLGTTSIGWAYVNEAQNKSEKSSIVGSGVRVIPLSTDEQNDFSKGNAISINADRTLKRGMRRNLDRYQLRRTALIETLIENGLIDESSALSETGKGSTHELWKIRSKAASEKISLDEFSRVLLAINKKRGYKSNRKAKDEDDGVAIDGMSIARELYDNNLTPGQFALHRLKEGKKHIPDFYRSDLIAEYEKIWSNQLLYHPSELSHELKDVLQGKSKKAVYAICEKHFGIKGLSIKGSREEKRIAPYSLRSKALQERLTLEELTIALQSTLGDAHGSSGYLGSISDRSKQLMMQDLTVGQYLFQQLQKSNLSRTKNQVFYRQDYLDEFERIWQVQSSYYPELDERLKTHIRDIIIFYQRRLKSQKGLLSVCELEGKETIIVDENKKTKKRVVGPKVCPKSSPLFQEFRLWTYLNNLSFSLKEGARPSEKDGDRGLSKDKAGYLPDEQMKATFKRVLDSSENLSQSAILKLAGLSAKRWKTNYPEGIVGNKTSSSLLAAYLDIAEMSGHDIDSSLKDSKLRTALADIFNSTGIKKEILDFNPLLTGKEYEKQASYLLWHLLYSYEGDEKSRTGNEGLIEKLKSSYGFERQYAERLIQVSFEPDHASLSTSAMRKIMPFLQMGHTYDIACDLAGYNHSHSLSKQENEERELLDKLDILPKNSLRNPVVEKILNQMIHVVNKCMETYGRPDEIRVEIARELKASAKERKEMTQGISKATKAHDEIRKKLSTIYPFNTGVRITRNDVIKYKLYDELAINGHKTLYTNHHIKLENLFSKEYDIEHIIPKSRLFDDSFSNKTLAVSQINRDKSNASAMDFMNSKFGEKSKQVDHFKQVIEKLKEKGSISHSKYKKLMMKEQDIPDGFIERDLRNTQYISKKAIQLLSHITRHVTPTTGRVTSRLRDDWQLTNVLQELNWEKYELMGLTYHEKNKHGDLIRKIKGWSKRNDHRHHAMDAIAVAFTKKSHIQYLNYLNARKDEEHEKHVIIKAIENRDTFIDGERKRRIIPPIPIADLRADVKKSLENILISFKAKNKVTTRTINKTKKKVGTNSKLELTPRGQLHKETIYALRKHYVTKDEKVGAKFDIVTINKVAKKKYREALMARLTEFESSPKKAFTAKNALSKNPIYLDEHQSICVPEIVKLVWLENRFTIRKAVSSELKIEKVVDTKVKRLLQERLDQFNGNKKLAFDNLEEKPIWLNEEAGIPLTTVSITGVTNAEALNHKKDHHGHLIKDTNGLPIPNDFVQTGNNHHVAIYRDANGDLQEKVVSFFEAVARVKGDLKPVDHSYNASEGWEFLFTMKQNEYFVFPNVKSGFSPKETDLNDINNRADISKNLYRVQKIAKKNYMFRHHLDTTVEVEKELKDVTYINLRSLGNLSELVKVRVNHLGQVVHIGE